MARTTDKLNRNKCRIGYVSNMQDCICLLHIKKTTTIPAKANTPFNKQMNRNIFLCVDVYVNAYVINAFTFVCPCVLCHVLRYV